MLASALTAFDTLFSRLNPLYPYIFAQSGEKQVSDLSKDIETNEKELSAWMDKHAAIYRELETTYNEMSGY